MKARLLPLFFFLSLTGRILADGPTLGPPVESESEAAPQKSKTPPPPVLPFVQAPSQGQADRPPEIVLPPEREYSTRGLWIDGEALLWWLRPGNLPPLITASPAGTPRSNVGVLGVPGTAVLFGGPVNGDLAAGGRIAAGYWLNDERTWALEGYFFQLGAATAHASAGSPGSVGRPFYNAGAGLPDAQLVSLPGLLDGAVQGGASSNLLGAGVLARRNLYRDRAWQIDALVGYRYLSLSDNVAISENLTSTDPTATAAPLGTNLVLADNFHTANYFNGGDVGLAGSLRWNAWTLGATARLALGTTYERVDINGATSVTVPGFPTLGSPGGLLALSSNSGLFSRNVFAVAPEMRLRLAYDLNARTRLYLGYTFLYWSRVVRAGDQIDLGVNPALLPPAIPGVSPQRPVFSFHEASFWAQGIDFGLGFRF